jgi:hypothetical protein
LLYEAIAEAEPLTPIVSQRATENRLRHYDRVRRLPDGLVALGDAACAFNPVYGQGMTAAAIGAELLDGWLRDQVSNRNSRRGPAFQRRLAQVIAAAWQVSAGADYRFRTTEGPLQDRVGRLAGRHIDAVMRAATRRPWIRQRLAEVLNLLRPPAALFGPGVLVRLLLDRLARLMGSNGELTVPALKREELESARPLAYHESNGESRFIVGVREQDSARDSDGGGRAWAGG